MKRFNRLYLFLILLFLLSFSSCSGFSTETAVPIPVDVEPDSTVQVTRTPLPTASPTPKTNPSPTPTREQVNGICSPLKDIELGDLHSITSQSFTPPAPYKDDGHPAVDLAFFTFKEMPSMIGHPVQSIFPGTVVQVLADRYPYGNAILIETPTRQSFRGYNQHSYAPDSHPAGESRHRSTLRLGSLVQRHGTAGDVRFIQIPVCLVCSSSRKTHFWRSERKFPAARKLALSGILGIQQPNTCILRRASVPQVQHSGHLPCTRPMRQLKNGIVIASGLHQGDSNLSTLSRSGSRNRKEFPHLTLLGFRNQV